MLRLLMDKLCAGLRTIKSYVMRAILRTVGRLHPGRRSLTGRAPIKYSVANEAELVMYVGSPIQ